ncbi:baculoviral IAP repeat-containing protein 1-like [Gigantopelta aegis]|uniref:baculoviral IAP repeat-containing protein 1-like n=1 Tax=Gigantopelta aegis TaxID=1735272 RepID=UPI001B8890F5|nr:baculoviral IAP repeat-containing protein 1-like [Gigantopelta aegis]
MDATREIGDRNEDGELVDEPTDQTDAGREYETDPDYDVSYDADVEEEWTDAAREYATDAAYEDDWYSRRYLFCPHPEMRHFYARMLTYAWWSIQMRQKPKELAKDSFYYTGNHDAAMCFCCGLCAYRWKKMGDPVMEHYRLSPRCPYVNNVFRH